MRKAMVFLAFVFVLTGCNPKMGPSDIAKLNGYWEIDKVVLADGSEKNYSMNQTYDYFEIANNKGFRTKVMPQLDGTFQTNGLKEKVSVAFENNKTILHYETPYAKWDEELKAIADSTMVVLNAEKKAYHYKKTGPINLMGDGKKAQ